MNATAVPVSALERPVAALERPAAAPLQRALPVLAISLLTHLGIILLMLVASRDPSPVVPREIPVELVQTSPAEPEKPNSKPVEQKKTPQRQQVPQHQPAQQRPQPQNAAQAKATPKPPQPKPPQPKPPVQPQQSVTQRMEKLLGPMPAVALPGTSDAGDEEVSYKQLVLSQVAKAKKEGRYRGIPGVASVAFSLGDHGELVRCEVVRKSADPNLNEEAKNMVQRAAPFPVPPAGAVRDFVIGLRFQAMP